MNKEAPVPGQKETQPKLEKLLSETTTGGQALVLLGIEPPASDKPVLLLQKEQKEQLLKSATEGIPADHKKRLATASLNERDEFWKDTPEAERMDKWRAGFNGFLEGYTKDDTKTAEQNILKNILKRNILAEITADTVYSTFIQGEGKGDIEYYARRVVETNSIEDIEKHADLIKRLGSIYGYNSAKIGELLTHGIANARHNLEKFAASAQENLTTRTYGADVWTPLAQNAAKWDAKQHTRQAQPMQDAITQPLYESPQTAHPPEPEQQTSVEYHPFVADAGFFSEEDKGKPGANQDAYFVDRKYGAFGVFDGMGSYPKSGEAANGAKAYISEALAQPDLPIDETEALIRAAFTGASEELQKQQDARYQAVYEDIKSLVAGTLTDKEFNEKYGKPKPPDSLNLQEIRRMYEGPAARTHGWILEWIEGSTTISHAKDWQQDARYQAVYEDIKSLVAGTLTNEEFNEKYGPESRSEAQRIRRFYDPSRPDDIHKYLEKWIQERVKGLTTASIVKLCRGPKNERKAVIANLGDSRVYHYTAQDGKLRIVTLDDNNLYDIVGEERARELQDMKANGNGRPVSAETIKLYQSNPLHRSTWERESNVKKYPWGPNSEVEVPLQAFDDSSMTKYLPQANVEPNIYPPIDIARGDKLILTSDGVHDHSLTPEILDTITNPDNREAQKAATALVAFAKKGELIPHVQPGWPKDDTTAVVVEIK